MIICVFILSFWIAINGVESLNSQGTHVVGNTDFVEVKYFG